MKELLQGKVTEVEFAFGVAIAIAGGFTKASIRDAPLKECIKNGFMGFFVAIVSGLIFIEYFYSPSIIIASMGMSGYSGATFLESINVLGKTLEAIKKVLGQNLQHEEKSKKR